MTTYRPGNAQNIGDREEQQDSFAFSDLEDQRFVEHGGVLAVVADGMGGLKGGAAASQAAVRAFLEAYQHKPRHETIGTALDRSLRVANAAVLAIPNIDTDAEEAGTTLVAAVIHNDGLHWISVGDSRIYIVRAGQAEQVTIDHNYGLDLDAGVIAGELSADQAARDPQRESLTSYLGQSRVEAVDTNCTALPLAGDDAVLVCSDGLYRALEGRDIGHVAAQARNPQELCETLLSMVLRKQVSHQDNCTVLAVSAGAISERHTEAGRMTAGTSGGGRVTERLSVANNRR